MELEDIRDCVQRGAFFVTDHAIAEGFKEGIRVADMVNAILSGEIVESHAERCRSVILGRHDEGFPIHIVVDWSSRVAVDIVTTYIPQEDRWIKGRVRRKRRR